MLCVHVHVHVHVRVHVHVHVHHVHHMRVVHVHTHTCHTHTHAHTLNDLRVVGRVERFPVLRDEEGEGTAWGARRPPGC